MTLKSICATISRRSFLCNTGKDVLGTTAIAAITLSSTIPFATQAASADSGVKNQDRHLRFYNTHTGENLDILYRRRDEYVKPAISKLNFLMRDHRVNEAVMMDPKLYDQLWHLQQRVGGTGVFEIISGYRSPETNKKLRRRSSGVARKSYHMFGRALDIRLRGTKTSTIRKVALGLKAGGVGYYPSSDFIHIDTGPVRSWS